MPKLPFRPLILASSSVYRRELLQRLRLPFECVSPAIDEAPQPAETPAATALRLALAKARAVAAARPHALIIGSDQVADLDGTPLGKPGNHANAVKQLRAMRGRHVVFHTALCLLDAAGGRHQLENIVTSVQLRHLSDAQIERYLALEQPYDCAGSAKVESLGIALTEKIDSDDPTALIGLPLITLVGMLEQEGVEVLGELS
jgi:septum formation protein